MLGKHWVTTESVFLLHRRPKTQLKGRPNAQNPLSQKKSGQGGRVPLFRKKSCRTTQKHNAHTDLGGDFLFFFCCHLFKKVHKHNTNAKAQIKKMINVVTHYVVTFPTHLSLFFVAICSSDKYNCTFDRLGIIVAKTSKRE